MSWNAKVHWTEGLFLRPHHLQQSDRYLENALESRTRHVTPYPWGFASLEIDRDLAQQSKFALRRASGIMPDGGLFDFPSECPPPAPITTPETAAGQLIWLTMPARADNFREVSSEQAENAARYMVGAETVIDSTANLRIEEEIEVAYPRLAYEIRKTSKPGYVALPIARVVEVHDRTLVFDEKFAPPVLVCAAHPTVEGWLDRVIGWIGNKLDELSRYASDPTAGGGLQSADYLILQCLNREIPALKHFRLSKYVHPERLYETLLRIAGELATFTTHERRAREYGVYNHDDLESVFTPLLRDIQDFLSARLDRRAIRLELIERAPECVRLDNPGPHAVRQRDLRARSFGAPASDRNPAQSARLPQGWAEHQDERDRARPSSRGRGRAPADASAPDPRHHRPRLLLPGPHIAFVV